MIGCTMANKSKTHYPVQNHLLSAIVNGSGLGIINIPKGLSGLNRRLYRQNRVYRVKVDAIGNEMGPIDVFRLRDTFMLQRGFQEAMKAWNESYEAADEVVKDSSRARWRDFRIDIKPHVGDTEYLFKNLRASGTGTITQPVTFDEFNTALAYKPDGTSMDFGLKSDSNTFDIIAEYNKLGKVQADPSTATSEAAYEELQSDLNDNQVGDLQINGNLPPYDADDAHVLDVLEYVGTIYIDADGTSKSTTGFFDAPLGAVYVYNGTVPLPTTKGINGDDGNPINLIKTTVQRGHYKGVAAIEYVDVRKAE